MLQKAKNVYHLGRSIVANSYYGFPGRSLTVIGVTGTDGKTTTSHLIYHILKEAGKKAALISTVAAIIDDKTYDTGFHVSTPDAFHLQPYLKKARESKTEYVVQEVTSHALDQNRVFGIPFAVGVLTNITQEHLDYHKTFTNYVKAKVKLLHASGTAILNRDDASYNKVVQELNKTTHVTYGMKVNADINPTVFPFKTAMPGQYNKYNCLAAIAVCRVLGIADDVIQKAVATYTLPKGRMEVVHDGEFLAIVDFAHTPNSIEQALLAVKQDIRRGGRIIHVFGAAGERDRSKRSVMGKMSAKYADYIILTSEDPRSESAEKIAEDIARGIKDKKVEVEKILDRREAIQRAVSLAKKDDVIIVTGKGHELSMNFGAGEVPWDDTKEINLAVKHDKK
jgi:UDP-N-acetylmuramoyl-L-alanyl-D-glutamate--2,6-diaminopimelate ligase